MTQDDIGNMQNAEQKKGIGITEQMVHKEESERIDTDNGPNQVSNGKESTPREPGIARVGNTSPEEKETH